MDYKKIYDDLINRSKLSKRRRKVDGIYYEGHHIIPKCMGGGDKSENKCLLTAREHFLAHKLLVEIYPENKKLIHALRLMSARNLEGRDYRIGAREYERVMKLWSISFSGENNPNYGRNGPLNPMFGKHMTAEAKAKQKLNRPDLSGEKNPMFSKTHPEERKTKWSEDRSGEKNPNFGNRGEANSSFGVPKRKEQGEKLKAYIATLPDVECPYCHQLGKRGNMHKYHFENCKQNPQRNPKIYKCIYCGLESESKNNISHWHNDNCKHRPKFEQSLVTKTDLGHLFQQSTGFPKERHSNEYKEWLEENLLKELNREKELISLFIDQEKLTEYQ